MGAVIGRVAALIDLPVRISTQLGDLVTFRLSRIAVIHAPKWTDCFATEFPVHQLRSAWQIAGNPT